MPTLPIQTTLQVFAMKTYSTIGVDKVGIVITFRSQLLIVTTYNATNDNNVGIRTTPFHEPHGSARVEWSIISHLFNSQNRIEMVINVLDIDSKVWWVLKVKACRVSQPLHGTTNQAAILRPWQNVANRPELALQPQRIPYMAHVTQHLLTCGEQVTKLRSNYTALDAKHRKYASALSSTFTSTRSPDNAKTPKYDQFQPKGHYNEENPQSMTKMPGNPKFYPFH